jgi:hypothetical protein
MSPAVSLVPAACSSDSGGDSEIGNNSLQQGSSEASPSGAGARVVQEWVDSIQDAEDPEEDDDDDLRAYRPPPGEEDRFRRESAPSPEPSPFPLSPPPSPPASHNNNN